MDIENLKEYLLKKAIKTSEDFDNYCIQSSCVNCELLTNKSDCAETILFIVLCYGYALGADNQSISHDLDKMLKKLFPKLYELVTKR